MTLFWTVLTFVFLIPPLHALIQQYRSASFAQAIGTIDFSERFTTPDGDGDDLLGIHIAYHYRIGEKRYSSTVLYYGANYSDDNSANVNFQKFPVNSHPAVWYNPRNPQESVLIPGPQGYDFFLVVFVTPHAMAMLLLWAMLIKSFRPYRSIRSLNMRERGPVVRFRPSLFLPLAVGAATLAGTAFLSTFILVILSRGVHLAPVTMSITALTLAILTLLAVLITALLRSLGRFDITLDDNAGTVTKRKQVIPYGAITAIHVSNSGHTSKSEINSYLVRIHYVHNNMPSRLTLKSWIPTFPIAARLAAYLALHLHVAIYDLDENLLEAAP